MKQKILPKIIITNAKPEDAGEIQKLYYQTWINTYHNEEYGITFENLQYRYKDMLTKEAILNLENYIKHKMPENHKYLVAKIDKKIVGTEYLEKETDHNRLQGLYILPAYQGIGIGKKLWEEAKHFFNFNNKTIIEVAEYNKKAIEFYKKLGFIDTGKRYLEEKVTDEKIIKQPMIEMNLPVIN